MQSKFNIAIFASGSGTNSRAIMDYFKTNEKIQVGLVVTNREKAGVLEIAKKHEIPTLLINKNQLNDSKYLLEQLEKRNINFIVLAGFLQKIPVFLIRSFEDKIINIHPALLPKFGGKGMYGKHVHEAVISNQEKESGITVHYVTEEYDEGNIIFQKSFSLESDETVESLEKKIHLLEHQFFPEIIKNTIDSK